MEAVNIKVDLNQITGTLKPMHAVGQPPLTGLSNSLFHYLTRAGIPYSRLHDVSGWMGQNLYVDIPNLFRDFDADENDPASYDFAYTDKIIEGLINAGCEPYFRLGVTIENQHLIKAYRIFPPKDFEKWARICEHVIRHYNEGWANGFHFGITYWEIWNEPDDCFTNETAAMWKGTPEEFYRLYSITARHLKNCFGDTIKVGGYGNCGQYEFEKDKELSGIDKSQEGLYEFVINFMHGFLKYQKETDAPIDFFSWHVYDCCHPTTKKDFKIIKEHAEYTRRLLDKYGFTKAEHHLNEWNLNTDRFHRDDPIGAAKTLAFMLMMQSTSVDVMCYYDAGLGFSDYRSLLNADTGTPYRTYYAFMMFNALYRLKNSVSTVSDNDFVFALAARDNSKAVLAVANVNDYPVKLSLDLKGFEFTDVEVLRIDEENRYTLTGEDIKNNTLFLPPAACVEIKLFNLK
jgi:hypothetical protein